MDLFSFIKQKIQIFTKKSQWKSRLLGVDFVLAKDEIANIFHIGIEKGNKGGEELIAKKKFVEAWENYKLNPCLETAIDVLEISPTFWDIFEQCKPGGTYWFFKSPAVNKLGKSIIAAAHYCAESFKEELERNLSSEKERHEKYIHIYFEFFYFFMHMHNRIMFSIVGSDMLGRFNKHFGPLMVTSAVEYIIGHWPQELKEKITRDIFDKLNSAEIEYSTSRDILWKKDVRLDSITGDSLLTKLTRNIAANCGYKMVEYKPGVYITLNPAVIMELNLKVSDVYIKVMRDMRLESLIKEIANDIK